MRFGLGHEFHIYDLVFTCIWQHYGCPISEGLGDLIEGLTFYILGQKGVELMRRYMYVSLSRYILYYSSCVLPNSGPFMAPRLESTFTVGQSESRTITAFSIFSSRISSEISSNKSFLYQEYETVQASRMSGFNLCHKSVT